MVINSVGAQIMNLKKSIFYYVHVKCEKWYHQKELLKRISMGYKLFVNLKIVLSVIYKFDFSSFSTFSVVYWLGKSSCRALIWYFYKNRIYQASSFSCQKELIRKFWELGGWPLEKRLIDEFRVFFRVNQQGKLAYETLRQDFLKIEFKQWAQSAVQGSVLGKSLKLGGWPFEKKNIFK